MLSFLRIQILSFILASFFSSAQAQQSGSTYYDRATAGAKIIFSTQKPKPYVKNFAEPDVHYDYAESVTKRIDGTNLGACFAKVSDEFEQKLTFKPSQSQCVSLVTGEDIRHKPGQKLPTFLQYLIGQHERACDFVSGQEDNLSRWVEAQADHSIGLVEIYDYSLKLNQGDIFNAVLTIYQLLRNNARWWDVNRYNYDSDPIRQRQFFNKFVDIRGDLKERGPSFHADHAGSWYRIWGAILFQLNRFDETTFQQKYASRGTDSHACHALSLRQDFKIDEGSALADGASVGDELLKRKLGQEEDLGKIWVDLSASKAANEMIWSLLHRPCSLIFERAKHLSCTSESYLFDR